MATTRMARRWPVSYSVLTAMLGLAALGSGAAADPLGGVQTAQSTGGSTTPDLLDPVTVEATGDNPDNTLKTPVRLNRRPGEVQDTPQIINVISPQVMQEQGVTTLSDALRYNVPSISVSIGEGNGGMNGDQFRIRGFEAKGDVYIDGLRDFGVYTRDSFNYESVQVLMGPSGEAFGMGTVGGAINTVTKTPFLGDFYGGTVGGGMGPFARVTVDANQQLTETVAVRLNGMYTYDSVVDRDEVDSKRWGIAPSIAFGLGTDMTFTLSYLHQHDNRTPDFGVPVVVRPGGTVGKPVTEHGVDRSTWYGTDTDTDVTNVDVLTAQFSYNATDWLTLNNDTRLGFYDREFAASPVSCGTGATASPPAAPGTPSCVTALFDGDPATVPWVTRGGPGPYKQYTWGVQNIASAVATYTVGGFKSQTIGGVDVFYQYNQRDAFSYSPARSPTQLFDPSHAPVDANGQPYDIVPSTSNTASKKAESTDVGLFLSEQFWFTDQWSILAGFRWDSYNAQYKTSGPGFEPTKYEANSSFFSPMASLIFEPTDNQTYYFSYAESSNPTGMFIASAPNSITDATQDLQPEKNRSYEVGAKVSLLDGRLGLSTAFFWITKNNAKTADPNDPDSILYSGDRQQVKGVEVGVTGLILPSWLVSLNYTYLDSQIKDSSNEESIGKDIQFVPHNAFTLWTSYDVSSAIDTGPGDLLVGLGMVYRDGVYLNNQNTAEVPYYLSLDAMISYKIENYSFTVNGYNLTNRVNYDQLFGNRVVPAAGTTVIATIGVGF